LPDDFPDAAEWSAAITTLFEHRLRADYDNWSDTAQANVMSPTDAVAKAEGFVNVAKSYIRAKYGIPL
jgi:hypothetical protein